MVIERFDLGAISRIDEGRMKEAFEQALRRCMEDCKDRPAVDDERTVSLKASLVPVVGDDGSLESVDVTFQISDSVPKRKSRIYNMKSKNGALLFNELSPDDIRQGTIDQVEGPRGVSHAR